MACNCKNEAKLSWVRGNDVLLSIWLYEKFYEGGSEGMRAFALEDVDFLKVRLVNLYGRVIDLTHHLGEDANQILVDILGTTPTGYWSLEVLTGKNSRDIRSFESCLMRICEANQEADTDLRPIEMGSNATTTMTIQMLSSAVAQGKNAYELWIEAGNEGTLQDYLDLFIQPASRTRDGQMTKEAYAKLESIVEATAEEVDEAWRSVFGE